MLNIDFIVIFSFQHLIGRKTKKKKIELYFHSERHVRVVTEPLSLNIFEKFSVWEVWETIKIRHMSTHMSKVICASIDEYTFFCERSPHSIFFSSVTQLITKCFDLFHVTSVVCANIFFFKYGFSFTFIVWILTDN